MKVNGYVEFYDERKTYSDWERCAEFKYYDDAILHAKAAHAAAPYLTMRAKHADGRTLWHSDSVRDNAILAPR